MKNAEDYPNYWAMIAAPVLNDKELLAKPKSILLYGHITTLARSTGACWATNKYFSEMLNVSTRSITEYIRLLVDKGFIKVITKYKENSKQIEKRLIFPLAPMEMSFDSMEVHCDTPMEVHCDTPMEVHCEENNTSINNTSINNNKRDKREKSEDFSAGTSSDSIPYSEIIDYLNQKTGKHYKASTQKTKRLIRARFNENYTVDDFKKVIDNKCLEWSQDEKMSRYLRPETLFGTHFDSYLNQDNRNGRVPNVWADYYESNGGTEAW